MEDTLKEIKVITRKDSAGLIIPERILVAGEEGPLQLTVNRIIRRDKEKSEGEDTTVFTCLVEVERRIKTCDIRFYHSERKWYLLRMQ